MRKLILLLTTLILTFTSAYAIEIKDGGVRDGDVVDLFTNLADAGLNQCQSPAGVTINWTLNPAAYNTLNVKIVNPFEYTVNGHYYSAEPQTINFSTLKATVNVTAQTTETYRKYMLSIDKNGTITVNAGNTSVWNDAKLPVRISGYTPFGYLKIYNASTTNAFILGRMDLNTGNVTTTCHNLSVPKSGVSGLRVNDRTAAVNDDDATAGAINPLNRAALSFTLTPAGGMATPNGAVNGFMFRNSTDNVLVYRSNGTWYHITATAK